MIVDGPAQFGAVLCCSAVGSHVMEPCAAVGVASVSFWSHESRMDVQLRSERQFVAFLPS